MQNDHMDSFSDYATSPLGILVSGAETRLSALLASPTLTDNDREKLTASAGTLHKIGDVLQCFSGGQLPHMADLPKIAALHNTELGIKMPDLYRINPDAAIELGEFFLKTQALYTGTAGLIPFLNVDRTAALLDSSVLLSLVGVHSARLHKGLDNLLPNLCDLQGRITHTLLQAIPDNTPDNGTPKNLLNHFRAITDLDLSIQKAQRYDLCRKEMLDKLRREKEIPDVDEITTEIQALLMHLTQARQCTLTQITALLREWEQAASHSDRSGMAQLFFLTEKAGCLEQCMERMHTASDPAEHRQPDAEICRLYDLFQAEIQELKARMAAACDPKPCQEQLKIKLAEQSALPERITEIDSGIQGITKALSELSALNTLLSEAFAENHRYIPFDRLGASKHYPTLCRSLAGEQQALLQRCRHYQATLLGFLVQAFTPGFVLEWLDRLFPTKIAPLPRHYREIWNFLRTAVNRRIDLLTEERAAAERTLAIYKERGKALEAEVRESKILLSLFETAQDIDRSIQAVPCNEDHFGDNKAFLENSAEELLNAYKILEQSYGESKFLSEKNSAACEKIREFLEGKQKTQDFIRTLSAKCIAHLAEEHKTAHIQQRDQQLAEVLAEGLCGQPMTDWLERQPEMPRHTDPPGRSSLWQHVQAETARQDQSHQMSLGLENKKIQAQVSAFRNSAEWMALYDAILAAREQGNKIVREGARRHDTARGGTGREFIEFSDALAKKVHAYVTTPDPDLQAFKADVEADLKKQAGRVSHHYALWKPILANIAIALTLVGVLVLAGKAIHGYATGSSMYFFSRTRRERTVQRLSETLRPLDYLSPTPAG